MHIFMFFFLLLRFTIINGDVVGRQSKEEVDDNFPPSQSRGCRL